MAIEAWLRGPIDGVDPPLMPAAHAFVQAREEVARVMAGFPSARLWDRPAGAASVGFHLLHLAGSTDRLMAYARGEALTEAQLAEAQAESEPRADVDVAALVASATAAFDRALSQIRATPAASLIEARAVGRARLPSTVAGLVFHAAEHATRHVGQLVTTAKVVVGGY
jgi:uncharacterized damage-inducible protein DinB